MAVTDDVHAHHARCGPYLARLAVLAQHPADAPLPPGAAAEAAAAAGAVLAEAQAAGHAVVTGAAAGERPRVAEFLAARLARLSAVATAAVSAARGGDTAALRSELRRFEALTAALWTVHGAVTIPAPRPPAA